MLRTPHPFPTRFFAFSGTWTIKSKTALLLAAAVRQQGHEAYDALVPSLLSVAAQSALHSETACLVLQFVCEDVTQVRMVRLGVETGSGDPWWEVLCPFGCTFLSANVHVCFGVVEVIKEVLTLHGLLRSPNFKEKCQCAVCIVIPGKNKYNSASLTFHR